MGNVQFREEPVQEFTEDHLHYQMGGTGIQVERYTHLNYLSEGEYLPKTFLVNDSSGDPNLLLSFSFRPILLHKHKNGQIDFEYYNWVNFELEKQFLETSSVLPLEARLDQTLQMLEDRGRNKFGSKNYLTGSVLFY